MAKKKLTQILYSGLGGHGNIAFSVIEGDINNNVQHELLFYGIEDVVVDYKEKCKELNVQYQSVIKRKKAHFSSFLKIFNALKKSKPDAVIIHSSNAIIPAILFGLLFRARIVFVEHQPNEIKSKQEWFLSIFAMTFSYKIFLNSSLYKRNLKKAIRPFFLSKKIKIIPNGLDLEKFSNQYQKTQKDLFNITMAARLVNTKDHATLIKSFAKFKSQNPDQKSCLNIAGSGEKEKELKELTTKLNINDCVEFHGLLNENELIHLLNRTNIYIHATLGETMSTSIMQCLSMGLPSVISDIPGTRHMLIDGQTTILVPTQNVEKMTDAIEKLYSTNELSQEISRAARKYAEENFDKNLMFKRYTSALKL